MFLGFLYRLREHGIHVGPTEWLALVEVLAKHPSPSLDVLYRTARALCVKHESRFDDYDLAFSEEFGVRRANPKEPSEAERFLAALREGGAEAFGNLGIDIPDELRALLEEHKGAIEDALSESPVPMPDGIRTDEEGGGMKARLVARQRRFKNYRSDLTLGTRTMHVALSRLRRMLPEGPADQFDLEGTIYQSARNGGEIELVFKRRKKNRVKLVLLMDAGGTMTPHAGLVNRLFSAAKSQFGDLQAYYFHNCVYQQVYRDIERRDALPTAEVLEKYARDHWLIVVGDAHMSNMELIAPRRAVEGPPNDEPGLLWLERLRKQFVDSVWLNPLIGVDRFSSNHSVLLVQSVFDMYPMTVDGITEGVKVLMSNRSVRST